MIVGLLSFLFGCGPREIPFQQKDGAWYYHATLIADADAKSFQVLSAHYAKDVDTFELLDYGYARDRVSGYAYRQGRRVD